MTSENYSIKQKGSRWGHMLGPVLEGGAIDLLLDFVGQSVKSALSLYVSCLTPLVNRERKQAESETH